jgi:hypothetical protein
MSHNQFTILYETMLKDWILKIKNNSHFFCSDDWKYRVSGNILELYVAPQLINQLREYRCAVITIGQILRSLSNKAEKLGSTYIIQSFPSLEVPEIIATIRVEDRVENSENPFPTLKKELFNYSGEDRLRAIANTYDFDVVKTERPLETNLDFQSFENKTWFIITSKQDNPFTWLKLGNWKESMQYIDASMIKMESIFIFDLCSLEEWEQIKLRFQVEDHLQAVIAINN